MSKIKKIIEQLDNGDRATLDVPMIDGSTEIIHCVLKKTETSPSLKLLYPSNTIQTENLLYESKCRLVIQHGEGAVNLKVQIEKADNDNALVCTAFESIKPEELREYFRVMINISIHAIYQPGPKEKKNLPWLLKGKTIDLSGSGVLAMFPGKPQNNNHIQLEMDIPGQNMPILCQAKVIRTYRMRQKRYQVAFSFENIEQKTKDMIISCCLREQRRQLREKIRI